MATEAEQKAFEKVWDWFVVQGHPRSATEEGACMYRGRDGARCAVGVLVTDEELGFLIEGKDITSSVHRMDQIPSLQGLDGGWLFDLQRCHDDDLWDDDLWDDDLWDDWSEHMAKQLRGFASAHGLTIPEAS